MADPQILDLTNDGPLVAFNARDFDHEGDLWYGNLQTASIKIVYQAAETPVAKTDIWYPQLADGHLLWLEDLHDGPTVGDPVKAWSLKDMDLATNRVTVIAHDLMPKYGGRMYAAMMRFDGQRVGLLEALAKGGWQIEIRDLAGTLQSVIPVSGDPFYLALESDGVLYSTGKNDPASGAVGQMHFWHWTPANGSREIAADVFEVNAQGSLAAWVVDADASKYTSGRSLSQRIYTATAPFEQAQAISPPVTGKPTMGIDGMACGSGTVAWWERENDDSAPRGVLTLWQPGWASPIQVDTEGNASYFVSVRGNWLIWMEEDGRGDDPLQERVRGIPLSILTAERHV